ncbi:aminotransferase class I/II-fold pyridoxal phosphate-dependent enzyme [Roseibacterium sp. SDUM158016]|uniref:pyridoxal phosphate-dependent aminotransferase n=1 Tax=Roseicyclus sediminis TaxID=2980997 RepID=UPI0021D19235|nr:aminotransferase class I/II-fold pyridoxal phosphate-dependent enzyme [Roseibacterium sp. SDUM158016]MCU4653603.1 aminotransferase class I/II-fold pyridoxal phosphate-dependent enzyme [Roseibacterium sp. SDUM158016]
MPDRSKRIRALLGGEDDAWDIFYRARAMKAAGEPVLELTIGEHDTGTDPAILDAMHRAALDGHTGYASVPGIAALRDRIAARMSEASGVPLSRDNILVTPGGQAGLFAAHHAALDEGDAGLMIDPYYATYPGTIRAVGARPVAVAARPEDGFQPRGADIAAAARETGARSLLINSPNNPTGAVYSADTLDDIAGAAEACDLWVISDEVYESQVWNGRHLPFAARPGMAARTLTVGSMSKSHAMTGSRLGWVAGPADVVADMIQLATHTTYGVPGYIQEAALFALGLGPEAERIVAAPFLRRRDLVLARIGAQNLLRAVPPEGAMYVMIDVRGTGLSGVDFAGALLEETRVAVMPGESFGKAAAGHVRVALTLPDDAFAEALDRLFTFAEARAAAA